eukprot:scaffold134862_cov17-Tisochrysis_lutea.AAC.1
MKRSDTYVVLSGVQASCHHARYLMTPAQCHTQIQSILLLYRKIRQSRPYKRWQAWWLSTPEQCQVYAAVYIEHASSAFCLKGMAEPYANILTCSSVFQPTLCLLSSAFSQKGTGEPGLDTLEKLTYC